MQFLSTTALLALASYVAAMPNDLIERRAEDYAPQSIPTDNNAVSCALVF